MQLLFDNMAAVLVASTVVIIIVATQMNAQEAAIEAHYAYAARSQSIDLVETFKMDLSNLGAGVPSGQPMIETYTDDGDRTTTFTFYAKVNSGKGADYETISYVLQPMDTVLPVVRAGTKVDVPAYRLDRIEDGTSARVSRENITEFSVRLFDADGVATADPSQAREVQVRFVAATEMGTGGTYAENIRWQTRLRPTNLVRQ